MTKKSPNNKKTTSAPPLDMKTLIAVTAKLFSPAAKTETAVAAEPARTPEPKRTRRPAKNLVPHGHSPD